MTQSTSRRSGPAISPDELRELQASYRARLRDKIRLLEAVADRYVERSTMQSLKELHQLVHQMAGSAPLYAEDRLGRAAGEAELALADALASKRLPTAATLSAVLDRVREAVIYPKRILLVDDDEDVHVLATKVLRSLGHVVDSVLDGASALARLGEARPDLVILDLIMPGVDGWTVLETLQSMPGPPPVVVLTARSDYGAFSRGVRGGALAFIIKPFRFEELVATCQRALAAVECPPELNDRRREPRRMLVVSVSLLNREGAPLAVGHLTDISRGGAQVELGGALDVGSSARFALQPRAEQGAPPLVFDGRVRWCRATAGGFAHGLEFERLNEEQTARLKSLLERP